MIVRGSLVYPKESTYIKYKGGKGGRCKVHDLPYRVYKWREVLLLLKLNRTFSLFFLLFSSPDRAITTTWCQLSIISISCFYLFLWYYLANWNQNLHEFVYKFPYKNTSFCYDLSNNMATWFHSQHVQVQMIYNLVQIMFVSPFYWYPWLNLHLTKTWLSLETTSPNVLIFLF